MSKGQPPPVTFRSSAIEAQLELRRDRGTSLGLVAARDLARYYALVEAELRTLDLSEGEASAIVDALNGTYLDETSIPLLWADIEDGVASSGLAEKWGIDGALLVRKLRQLTPGACYAIADAVDRFWRESDQNIGRGLRRAGLVQDYSARARQEILEQALAEKTDEEEPTS